MYYTLFAFGFKQPNTQNFYHFHANFRKIAFLNEKSAVPVVRIVRIMGLLNGKRHHTEERSARLAVPLARNLFTSNRLALNIVCFAIILKNFLVSRN